MGPEDLPVARPIDPEHFVLFSAQGEVLDLYGVRGVELPEELRRNRHDCLQKNTEQSYFGDLDGRPRVMAAAEVTDDHGRIRVYLVVVAPFDEGFLPFDTLRHFDPKGGVVALAIGDPPRILTGSDVVAVPIDARADHLQRDFLVRGTDFFDYGSAEVRLQLLVLLRNAPPLPRTADRQHAAQTAGEHCRDAGRRAGALSLTHATPYLSAQSAGVRVVTRGAVARGGAP